MDIPVSLNAGPLERDAIASIQARNGMRAENRHEEANSAELDQLAAVRRIVAGASPRLRSALAGLLSQQA
ncbi:hypothetical protein BSA145_21260 (plasmid) [Bacillus safensis]|uniref:Uncharacterized protein n=1 Tax=Bacillus safensis TaxID=561879 RepID=A0A1L6ZPG7_BACIA|nr:hypothetical protein [Bacillus safensis]APT48398.1 hypothetical protein BSA145_21260 [Bacillus safensis]